MRLSVKHFASAGALAAAVLLGGTQDAAAQQEDLPAIVSLRKALMVSNQQHVRALGALLSGELNMPLHILRHAEVMEYNGRMLSQLFPEGSTNPASRATDQIWDDEEGFAARVQAFADATRDLNRVAQRGFNDQTAEALATVRATCAACHQAYRGPAPAD